MFGSRYHELILEYFQRHLTGSAEDILYYIKSKPVKAPGNHKRTRKRSPGVGDIGNHLRHIANVVGHKRSRGRISQKVWALNGNFVNARSHNIPFTYRPKIEAVRNGTCLQTIRVRNKRRKKAGDFLYLYGWSGKPYRSPWAWRRLEICSSAIDIKILLNGILYVDTRQFVPWSQLDDLAVRDHIDPPTGKDLGRVLISTNDISIEGAPGQIIRW